MLQGMWFFEMGVTLRLVIVLAGGLWGVRVYRAKPQEIAGSYGIYKNNAFYLCRQGLYSALHR